MVQLLREHRVLFVDRGIVAINKPTKRNGVSWLYRWRIGWVLEDAFGWYDS